MTDAERAERTVDHETAVAFLKSYNALMDSLEAYLILNSQRPYDEARQLEGFVNAKRIIETQSNFKDLKYKFRSLLAKLNDPKLDQRLSTLFDDFDYPDADAAHRRLSGFSGEMHRFPRGYFPSVSDEIPDDAPTGTREGEGVNPAGKASGRTPIAKSSKPNEVAKRNAYRLIEIEKSSNPKWGKKQMHDHFKSNKDFKELIINAGLKYSTSVFHAALQWILKNPSQETFTSQKTQSGNVS